MTCNVSKSSSHCGVSSTLSKTCRLVVPCLESVTIMTGDHYTIFRLPSPPVVSRSRDVLCMFVSFANESFAEDCHEYVDITLHYRCCHLSKQKNIACCRCLSKNCCFVPWAGMNMCLCNPSASDFHSKMSSKRIRFIVLNGLELKHRPT